VKLYRSRVDEFKTRILSRLNLSRVIERRTEKQETHGTPQYGDPDFGNLKRRQAGQ
jgi:hypothetical protein